MTAVLVTPEGVVRTLYTEVIDLSALGPLAIERASHVEPDPQGRWQASIVDGPVLGPFDRRSQALDAEVAWLEQYRLIGRVATEEP